MVCGINLISNKKDKIYNNIYMYKDIAISIFLILFVITEIEKVVIKKIYIYLQPCNMRKTFLLKYILL